MFDAAFLASTSAAPLRSCPTGDTDGWIAPRGGDGNASLLIMDHNQPQDHREKAEKTRLLIEPTSYVNCYSLSYFGSFLFFSLPPSTPSNQQSLFCIRDQTITEDFEIQNGRALCVGGSPSSGQPLTPNPALLFVCLHVCVCVCVFVCVCYTQHCSYFLQVFDNQAAV